MITPVLPLNQSDLETKIVLAVNALPRLAGGVELVRTGKRVIPDDLVPWLVWEYGLDEIIPWLKDPRRAIREGVKWQRQRGTTAALRTALGWIDFSPARIEETGPGKHFAEFQMDTGRVPDNRQLAQDLVSLSRLSAPARSRLSRVYRGYDVRRFILDNSPWGDFLDAESGVFLDDVIQSFGRSTIAFVDTGYAHSAPILQRTRYHAALARYVDRVILDYWHFGEEPEVPNYGLSRSVIRGYTSPPLDNPSPIGRSYHFVKAQIVLDDDGYKFGDTNARFPRSTIKEIGQTFVFGQDKLDEHVWAFETVPVLDCSERGYSAVNAVSYTVQTQRPIARNHMRTVMSPALTPNLTLARTRTHVSGTEIRGRTWRGGTWDTNTWRTQDVVVGMAHGSSNT